MTEDRKTAALTPLIETLNSLADDIQQGIAEAAAQSRAGNHAGAIDELAAVQAAIDDLATLSAATHALHRRQPAGPPVDSAAGR